ncbi:MAG TPA: efflux RND transporter periplasmic adaptor subunit [Chthoniobacterales bacterium]|jgi:multidrug efflux system membrane fusion protein|nr:efflux RND transporter periplasmic adaptor subunit [Chthoniobacterales bacterium]
MSSVADVNTAMRERVTHLERRYGRKRVYLVSGIVVILVVLSAIRVITSRQKAAPPPAPRSVTVSKVITKDVPLYLDEIGTCTAAETVQVQAQISGQILSRDFEDGADVKKGDVLFRIDPRPFDAALASAQADAALAHATFERQKELRTKAVVAGQDYDVAMANAMKADAAVKSAQVNLDYCTIRSPIDGRTNIRNVDVGNLVAPSSPPLVTVQRLDPIYTDFTVAEPDIPLVRQHLNGAPLQVLTEVENDNHPPRIGELTFIDNAVQPGAGTVRARATTENHDHALWAAQFVHVRLILETLKNAMLVPSSAVQIGQNGPYVFVVKSDSTLDLRQVKPGQRQEGEMTVITQGVTPGESVVTRGQLQLAPGMKVAAQEDKISPAGGAREAATAQ